MIIEYLKLSGFRNLENERVSFCKNKNLIHGLNGSGKTSILEAIFLLGFGKSFLSVKKSDIINDGSNQFILNLKVTNFNGPGEGRKNEIAAHFKNKLSLLLNEKKSNIFEINEYLYPVFFSSSNYNLYIESKTYIRKLVDRFVFGIDSLYIHYLLSYNKALRQKNYLLKSEIGFDEIRSWNKVIGEMSEKIVNKKIEFIGMLNEEIEKKFHLKLAIDYSPSFSIDSVSKDSFYLQMEKKMKAEMLVKRTLLGPHLDDFEIRLNGKNLKFYSSGEKKINLLMVYISFIELFRRLKNDYPVFLVDDFDTAIDDKNIDFLINNYPDLQVIATSVNKNVGFDRLIELTKGVH